MTCSFGFAVWVIQTALFLFEAHAGAGPEILASSYCTGVISFEFEKGLWMHSALCFVQKLVKLLVFLFLYAWFLSCQNIFFIFMLATVRQGGWKSGFWKALDPQIKCFDYFVRRKSWKRLAICIAYFILYCYFYQSFDALFLVLVLMFLFSVIFSLWTWPGPQLVFRFFCSFKVESMLCKRVIAITK